MNRDALDALSAAIAQRVTALRQTIPPSVRIIAVSKTFSADDVRAAYGAGLRDFGENRVQEAIEKQALLADLTDIRWHLIGHLQSNKARKAIEHFDWIHSVDSLALLQRLQTLAVEGDRYLRVCLQVKHRPDPTKSGWEVPLLLQQLYGISECNRVLVKGMMTIPPQGLTPPEVQRVFEENRDLALQLAAIAKTKMWPTLQMEELSMGMSGDYPQAIQAGTTMVRLGQIIFGNRS